jgi:hypothetical protein
LAKPGITLTCHSTLSAPEYVAGFFLVIIGFAVSEVLKGSAELIRERKRIRFYWPYLLMIPFVLEVLMVVFLWLFTKVNKGSEWSVVELTALTLVVAPYAFISYLIFPSQINEDIDLKEYVVENGKVVLLVSMAQILIVIVLMIVMGSYVEAVYQAGTLLLSAIVWKKFAKLHVIWIIAMILLTNYFVFFMGPITIK